MILQTLKGFRDFLPEQAKKRQYVIEILKKVFESYGFEPLETPSLEYEEILLDKYGEEGDKLMYRFTDNGGRKVALRYDQTVPLARVVAQYGNELPMPFKRYQIQQVFRAENPQKGRFREFLQCDADIVGVDTPLADAEVIALAVRSLEELGFKNYKVLINDRAIFTGMPLGIVRALDKLKKIDEKAVIDEITKTGLTQDAAMIELIEIERKKPTQTIQTTVMALENFGVEKSKVVFSPTLARGLDYYTGMIFEIEIEGYSGGSVCGGGRYDNLIGIFSGKPIPATGFAFGFDRLIEAMEELKLFPDDLEVTKVLVTVFSPDYLNQSLEICSKLRDDNINVEIYLDENTPLDKQLKYADKKQIPYVVIIGENEIKENKATIKDLRTREQKTVTIDELADNLK